ncbi:MAG TPA: ABC transporter substrate-binding protein [Candidatus Limnocylindrales bacterium]
MMISVPRRLAAIAAITALVGACGGGTPAPATSGPGQSQTATTTPSVAPSPIAVVPDGQLAFAGKLLICSDLPYPPQEYFDDQGNPTGSDIDLGFEIGRRLGLKVQIENAVFDTIIAAVTGGKCDIVISAQNITPDRQKQVDMIPYFMAGQEFMVLKGNPKGFKTLDDLCGAQIAAESGTTEAFYILGTDQYTGKGLTKECTDKGKAAPVLKQFQKDSDSVLALQSGQVDVYFGDVPVVANYATTKADQFEVAPIPALPGMMEGISVPKDKTGLRDAVKAALISAINDGTYLQILKKYGVDGGAITAADVK